MRSIFGVLVVVGGCAFIGCAHSSGGRSTPLSPVGSYMPLAEGDEWTYQVWTPRRMGRRTIRMRARGEDGFFEDTAGGAFKVDEEGLRDRRRYLMRAPLTPGRYWTAAMGPTTVETYEVVSVGRPCDCPLGRFDQCVVVRSTVSRSGQAPLRSRMVWARGIGLVEVTHSALLEGRGEVPQAEYRLIGYRVNGVEVVPPPTDPAADAIEEGPSTWGR